MAPNSQNCFDPMRHLAALAVLVSHQFAICGAVEPAINAHHSLGNLGVLMFFSISGYLITQSFLNSDSARSFFQKRCARIFPALMVCSFLMVYPGQYFFGDEATTSASGLENVLSFIKISLFGQATLPGITSGFIIPTSFNASLWTLKVEFACYILLGAGLVLNRTRLTAMLLAGLAITATLGLVALGSSDNAHKLAIYGSVTVAFFSGSTLFFFRDSCFSGPRSYLALAMSIALLAAVWNSTYIYALGGVAFSYLFLWVGLSFNDKLIRRRFDISYGVYVFAFPIQQIVVNKLQLEFAASLSISLILTLLLATVSWKLIEEPALHLVNRKKRNDPARVLIGQHPGP